MLQNSQIDSVNHSKPLAVAIFQITGLTTFTCGCRRSTSAIFTETGGAADPRRNDDPAAARSRPLQFPAVRFFESFMIRSTINDQQVSVTSSAIATILMSDRIGRCTRLAKPFVHHGKPASQFAEKPDCGSVLKNPLGSVLKGCGF